MNQSYQTHLEYPGFRPLGGIKVMAAVPVFVLWIGMPLLFFHHHGVVKDRLTDAAGLVPEGQEGVAGSGHSDQEF